MKKNDNLLAVFCGFLMNGLASKTGVHFAYLLQVNLLDTTFFSFCYKFLDVAFFAFVGGVMAILGKKSGELLYKLPLVQRLIGRFVKLKPGQPADE